MKIGNAHKIIEYIKKFNSIVIFHHIRSDGDCLGAQFGLKALIKSNFPKKKVYAIGDVEGNFAFLNLKHDKIPSNKILAKSLGIIVDANFVDRIKFNHLIINKKITNLIRIDHHPNLDDLEYLFRWVDSSYVATSEQIADMAISNKWQITKKAATFIYLGINTDSGRFLFEKTTPRTLRLAADLWEKRIDLKKMNLALLHRTKKDIQVMIEVLKNYKTNGKVTYYIFTLEAQKRLKLKPQNCGRVNLLANISDQQIWLFFIYETNQKIRVEFRSNGPKVNQVAKKFGGGGHDHAAGAIIANPDDITKVIKECLKTTKQFL